MRDILGQENPKRDVVAIGICRTERRAAEKLEQLGINVKGGFNIFRRFRITHLEKSDCPEALKHFWSGHARAHVSDRYVKLLSDRAYRLDWAERVGTGFVLSVGQPGLLHLVWKTV